MVRVIIYDWLNFKLLRYDVIFFKKRMFGVKFVGWIEVEIDEWLL